MELFKEGYIMNKKVLKVITTLLLITLFVSAFVAPVFGRNPADLKTTDYETQDKSGASDAARRLLSSSTSVHLGTALNSTSTL